MARYGANELFNPGGRRKKKKDRVVITGSSSGSFGSMAHSQAPDAVGMMTQAMDLDKKFNEGKLVDALKDMFSSK
jgi:hypothetical protein